MKSRIKHLVLFIILICIDQTSKYWVRTVLVKKDSIVLIPDVLKLQYHTNTGAVWGMLSNQVVFLSIFTFIVLLLLIFLYFKIPAGKKFSVLKVILVFIMAGAVGNLIDRVFLGHVIDFIYFELINFPLFNFADSCLTVSSILLFLLAIFYFKDEDFAFIDQLFRRKKSTTPDAFEKSGKADSQSGKVIEDDEIDNEFPDEEENEEDTEEEDTEKDNTDEDNTDEDNTDEDNTDEDNTDEDDTKDDE